MSGRWFWNVGLALVLWLAMAAAAQADKRVALVIGMSKYSHVEQLANPENDANAVAGLLRKAGFDTVDARRDLTIAEMRRAVREFAETARDADIAVIYYAGHGIEVDGANYLIPIDARLVSDFDVEDETVSLDRLLKALEPARRLRLVILDACRVNPFASTMRRKAGATRAIGRGLARVEPTTSDTLVAFAAKAGAITSDGAGGTATNSPFTTALVKYLAAPGLDLRLAFGRVRDEVLKVTGNQQEPFVYGSLGGETVALVPAPVDPNAGARRDYELAAQIGTREAWATFLARYPDGFYAGLARAQDGKLAAAEQARASADEARRKAEDQARQKADDFRRQLEEQSARQTEDARKKMSEQAKRDLEAARQQAAEQALRERDSALQQLDEAKRQADAARRQVEQARQQAVADAQREVERARAEAARANAGLEKSRMAMAPANDTPTPAPPPAGPTMDPADIARLLQAHLKRVGCDPGALDGSWNDGSIKALERFNKRAGTSFNFKVASLETLDAVRAKSERVCPLECARGQRAEGDRCVVIGCDSGFVLGADGTCKRRPEPPPRKQVVRHEPRHIAPSAPAGGGGGGGAKCFSFNGKRYCE
ncbi:caspase family protein [Bradyrhizobium sp. 2TAF24]|uniref:caspase family protein n=1 Tax=Bradyrhizobium sp. 2TAF24 TaxID=3233011 RepID=UPI003F9233D6